jgi:hypothetical protein
MNPRAVSETAATFASGRPAARSSPNAVPCAWCGRPYTPRTTGGHAQRFCRSACRRGFDAAGRRWVAEAIATGMLTLDALRNGAAATRALLAGAIPPTLIDEPQKPAPVASAEGADEAVELLDDFLVALLELPGDTWPDLTAALPDELFDRIDRYLEAWLSEPAGAPTGCDPQ